MFWISQFTSEAKHALESQRGHLINEASLELSRRGEQAQHLQVELQFQAASHVSESPAGLCYFTTKLGYDTARKKSNSDVITKNFEMLTFQPLRMLRELQETKHSQIQSCTQYSRIIHENAENMRWQLKNKILSFSR